MTFKTKFRIGDVVDYSDEDAPEGVSNPAMTTGKYRIFGVQLSCFADSKIVTYLIAAPGRESREVTEARLLLLNATRITDHQAS